MSVINIYHEIKNVSIKKGKKVVDEEFLIQGEKGLKIKYFHKDDKESEKIVITGKDGVYKMKSTTNGETEEKELDEKGLEKELKGKLKFAKEQLKGGAKKPETDLEGGRKSSKRSKSSKSSKKSTSKKSKSKKSSSKK